VIELNKIYNQDCLEGLKLLEDNSIDCVWTDPPYNIGYKYDEYKDNKDLSKYFDWCDLWLKECSRVLKPEGSIFVKMWSRHLFDFQKLLDKNSFVFKNIIIWKRKSCANYSDKFLGGYELIFFFTKSKESKFIPEGFLRDTQFLKRWDGTKEYKGRLNDLWDDIKPVTAGNLIHPEGCYKEGSGSKEHPAQHPEELVARSIQCTTNEGDIVLDIFMGSGTVANVCKKSNRNFIGFETSQEYCNVANRRISKEISQTKLEVKSGCDANDDGIPPNNKLLGILPTIL
jgi:DNA modification methylase